MFSKICHVVHYLTQYSIKDENNNYYIDNKLLSLSREICYVQNYDDKSNSFFIKGIIENVKVFFPSKDILNDGTCKS